MIGMDPQHSHLPRFFCDAMLGGLVRWLRAAGYDAQFEYGIDDGELVRRSLAHGQVILSSDGRLFERTLIRSGQARALYVPGQLGKLQQLRFVLESLNLPVQARSRCMGCGGELREVPRHRAAEEAPPLAFRFCERFWRCERCGRLLWHGTHWQKIARALDDLRKGPMPQGPSGR